VEQNLKKVSSQVRHPASFRDPSGFLFERDGEVFRQVNRSYQSDYQELMESGLYKRCVDHGWMVPHEVVDLDPPLPEKAVAVLRPEIIPFISYPYEWCFSQLKDAALITLRIQREALQHGLSLKDASAFNIQFHEGRPVLIDSLSFERLHLGKPWIAYRQFCQHFLAPLALMAYRDVRLAGLMRIHIDGIPLDMTAELLPRRTLLNFGLLIHIHLHASAQRRTGDREIQAARGREISTRSLEGLVANLESAIEGLHWQQAGDWSDYYDFHNYGEEDLETKMRLVEQFLETTRPSIVWDLGANTGRFSRLASNRGALTLSMDFDPGAVEANYLETKAKSELHLVPLLMDLTNPTPSLGWDHEERNSLLSRGPADLVMALALIHHLAIGNNVPFPLLARFLAKAGRHLIIEFVPKSDPQVGKLLISREDIFDDYSQPAFEWAFEADFRIHAREPIGASGRTLYLMEPRSS
jgi:hypothetical protein